MATPEAPNLPACPLAIAERTLSALRDEALSPAEAAHLAAHAETCPTCRARLAAFADLAAVLRSERPPEPDERLWRTFAASTPMTHSRSRFHLPGVTLSRQSWNKLGALAAVLLLTLGFLTVSNLQRAGISVRTTPSVTLAPAGTSTPMPTATPDLRPAHPLTWQPAITSAPGEVTAVADDGESAYACSVTASVAVTGLINIWRTPDRGASWLPAQSVPSTPTANGCELVVDASDPSVAALAWAPRGGGAGDSFTGLMTTVDGGMTWQAQPQQPFTRIDQLDSRGGVIYALRETAPGSAVESHLWASSDRMQTWRQVDPGQTLSSAVAGFWLQPDGPGILAVVSVGGGGIQAQLYYSPNNGVTWNHLNVPGGLPLNYTPARFFSPFGLPNGIVARSIQGRFHICVSLSAPNAPTGINNPPQIHCTGDTGAMWHTLNVTVLTNSEGIPVGPTLVAIADDGDLLASGPDALYRLLSGADKWQSLGTPPPVELIYSPAPGSGLLWAIPSGPPPPGYIYTTYTASYAP